MIIRELKAICHVCDPSEILVRISNRIVKISKYEDEGDGAGSTPAMALLSMVV